jgi:hypothetical protein
MLFMMGTGCAGPRYEASVAHVPARGEVAATVTADIRAGIDEVYDYVVREDTPARDLRAYGPIGGVRGSVKLTAGGWDHPGARRVVVLDDGATLVEQIDALERPLHFAYHVNDFSFVVKDFATGARGDWVFTPTAMGTHVVWTYTFAPRSCPAEPALRALVATLFKPYMAHGMASIRVHIEGAPKEDVAVAVSVP